MALPVATADDVLTIGEMLEESFEMQTASLRESVDRGNGFLAQLVELTKEDKFAKKENRLEAGRQTGLDGIGDDQAGQAGVVPPDSLDMTNAQSSIASLLVLLGVGGVAAGENTLTGALKGLQKGLSKAGTQISTIGDNFKSFTKKFTSSADDLAKSVKDVGTKVAQVADDVPPGMVRAKSGQLYPANSPQGQMIKNMGSQAGEVVDDVAKGATSVGDDAAKGAVSAAKELLGKAGKFVGRAGGVLGTGAYLGLGEADIRSDLETGEITEDEAMNKRVGLAFGAGGGLGGAAAGAAAGATIGSVVPVVGTIVGGIAGGILGGLAGTELGEYVGEAVADPARDLGAALAPSAETVMETGIGKSLGGDRAGFDAAMEKQNQALLARGYTKDEDGNWQAPTAGQMAAPSPNAVAPSIEAIPEVKFEEPKVNVEQLSKIEIQSLEKGVQMKEMSAEGTSAPIVVSAPQTVIDNSSTQNVAVQSPGSRTPSKATSNQTDHI